MEPRFHIALVHPEIPQNTGNVGRLCVGLGARLHLVHPLGFSLDQKAVRRAGIDHWRHVDLQEHRDLDAFLDWLRDRRAWFFSARGRPSHRIPPYRRGDVLVFGCESRGLPGWLVRERGAWAIPLPGRGRSLNLANAVAVVAYAALEATEPRLFRP